MTQRTPQCAPWCTDHDDCTNGGTIPAGPNDGLCETSTTGTYGQILMSHSADHGIVAHLYNLRDELTADGLEELGRAALALAAQARIGAAA